MTPLQKHIKRIFDLFMATLGLLLCLPILLIGFVLASISTGKNGLYASTRIGQYGKKFTIYKLRTMQQKEQLHSSVTAANDPRITKIGRFLRKTKLDELPQLFNVLKGDMSLVGPRPDVPGFADKLQGKDRIILEVKPGITGLATVAFKDEEELLAQQENPEQYNREVIWPEKVRLNKHYAENYSFFTDLKILWKTVF